MYEFQTIQTLMGEEVRTDEETGEEYIEQIVVAKDKKLRTTIDLLDIDGFEEFTNDKGAIYAKRCVLNVKGNGIVVTKSYDDIREILKDLNSKDSSIGFGRDKKEA